MKKLLFILLLFFATALTVEAQQFSKAVGIRAGLTSGFEYRFYTDDVNSYKILLTARNHGTQIGIMKEFHKYDLFDFSDQLVFIYGIGVHGGYEWWHEAHYELNRTWYNSKASLVAGLDALAAVEYTFYEYPVSVGFEVKPFFNVWGQKAFDLKLFDFAFTLKYLF